MKHILTNAYIHKSIGDSAPAFVEQMVAVKNDEGDYDICWARKTESDDSVILDELRFSLSLKAALYVMNGWESDQLLQIFGDDEALKTRIYASKKSCNPQHYSRHAEETLCHKISPLETHKTYANKALAALNDAPLKVIYGAELHMLSDNPEAYICPEYGVILTLAERNEEESYSIVTGQRLGKFDDGADTMVATCRTKTLPETLDALYQWEYSTRHRKLASGEKENSRPLHYRKIAALIGHEFPLPENVLAFKAKKPSRPKI